MQKVDQLAECVLPDPFQTIVGEVEREEIVEMMSQLRDGRYPVAGQVQIL